MGGRGSKSSGSISASAFQIASANVVPNATIAQSANNANFSATDNSPYHNLYGGRQYFNNQNLTIDQQLATMNYLSNTPEAGSLYSMSQNLNHALATGQPLTANQQYVLDNMEGAMHNLGYNLNLTRYDHADMVNNLLRANGVRGDYSKMTQAQLKQALVGTRYGEERLLSTSYNDFANAPPNSKAVFDTRAVKISYKAPAATQAMMPGKGPGGDLGEIVLDRSKGRKNYEVTDVIFTGKSARAKGTQSYSLPQVELVVQVYP